MRNSLYMIILLLYNAAQGQQRKGFEQFYYPDNATLSSLSSKLFYQGNTGWYTEWRWNYEEQQSIACSVGKTYSKEGALSYSFTPSVGLIAGDLQGISAGLNTSLRYRSISFSTFMEYANCSEKKKNDLFFSWSELTCQITRQLYAGLVLQQKCLYPSANTLEAGMQLGVTCKNWTFPLYLFKPANSSFYFAVGICREWEKQP